MRLNNQIKDQIVQAAIAKAGIPDQVEALRQRRAAWAEAVRIDAMGAETTARVERVIKSVSELLAGLPEELLSGGHGIRRRDKMYVNVAGVTAYARFNGGPSGHDDDVSKPSMKNHTLLADHPLVAEFYAIEHLREDLESKRLSIEVSVKAALSKVTTDTKLLQVWPEAAELMPAPTQRIQLPALPTADLNALIGLPSEKEAV